jgi:hypothetical protein
MAFIGNPSADNSNLLNTTVSTVSVGTGIDVSGFATLLVQVSGSTFNGIITFERSLDNIYWSPALITELNALNQKTQIETAGLYFVRTEAQFIRYNVTNITGSATIVIDGTTSVVSNADKVAWAMDETNNSPLNIKFQPQNSGVKQDLSGAFILSDAPTTQTISAPNIGTVTIIDTQGYQSLQITSGLYAGSISGSNDSIGTYVAILGYNLTSLASVNAITASGNFSIPITTRYIKLTCTTAGPFTYSLRNIASPAIPALNYIGGTAVNSATAQLGVNIQQTGGTTISAVGATQTALPLSIGGVDPLGASRRATSTMLGDLITGNRTIPTSSAALSSTTTGNTPIGAAGFNNQIPQTIQDTSQFEGQSQIELLAQMLQEIKILNQQMYELPRVIALALQGPTAPQQGQSIQLGDDPFLLRQDSSLFINQQ